VREILNGYIPSPVIAGTMDDYITPPRLGKHSAILGAMAMAKELSMQVPILKEVRNAR
jgi:hypothetical protein